MRARAALYARGLLRQQILPCRVISVGNLTVGGTGKTPVVIALAAALRDRGRKVGVISRGYKRRSETSILEISDGRTLRGRSEEHTSELQSRLHLVCRLLLEKKKTTIIRDT